MKNFKLSKKLKTLLWTSSAIVLNTAIASSLTSCSLFNKDVINDIGGYDKKYGITEATYNRAEDDLRLLYETRLDDENIRGLISDKECASKRSNFRSNLNTFHNSLSSHDNGTLSYTNRLNALKVFSKNNYSIYLDRDYFNISISEFYETLDSFVLQLYLYLKQNDCEQDFIDYWIGVAKERGTYYIKEKEQNPDVDWFTALQDFRSFLTVETMSEINSKVAEFKASRALKQFFDEYTIIPRKKVDDRYTWDALYSDPFFYSNSQQNNISAYINKIFIIKRNEDGVEFEYSRSIIQGFDLIPRTVEMPFDANSNTYKVKINWEIKYLGSSDDKYTSKFLDEGTNFKDEISDENNITCEYELPVSLDYEKQQLKSIYLNNIELKWDDLKNNCGKEAFFTKDNKKDVELDAHSLAIAGLKINETRLQTLVPTNLNDINTNPKLTDDALDSIEQQFVTNCNLSAKSQIFYDDSDKIICQFYIGFKHSYASEDTEELNKNHTFSNHTDGFEEFNWMKIECTGMQTSEQFYLNALSAYNSCLVEINTFSNSITMVQEMNSTYYTSLGIQIATSLLFGTFMAITLTKYILSFCLNAFLILSLVSMSLQLLSFTITMGTSLATILRMLSLNNRLKSFVEAVGIGSEFATKYPTITGKTDSKDNLSFMLDNKKQLGKDYSKSKFIGRLISDYDIFTTKEKFSKTIDGLTPNDRFIYYSDLENNLDYKEYEKIKEKFQADKNSIQNSFWIDTISYDEQKKDASLTFSTIVGDIVSYCMWYNMLQDIIMMTFLFFKGNPEHIAAATCTQIASNEAADVIQILIKKFFLNVMMYIAFQFAVPDIIQKIPSWFLPDMSDLPDIPTDGTTRGVLEGGSIELNAYIYVSDEDSDPWTLYIDAKQIEDDDNKLIQWELKSISDDEELPSEIKIDQNGLVSWEPIHEIIEYKFYVIATYVDQKSKEVIQTKSSLITLTVQRKDI